MLFIFLLYFWQKTIFYGQMIVETFNGNVNQKNQSLKPESGQNKIQN